jgi:hypothetical protein
VGGLVGWGGGCGVVSVDDYVGVVGGVYGFCEFLLHCFFVYDGGLAFFVFAEG